ncbi:hypothetical protein Tco_0173783 [Tanacetum coccineum]
MFKVFNRCLTSRLTGHDQTKINILQIFHAVVYKVHVDYASLLWWDFIHYVKQKKNVIQYPRFTKLIIANIMAKYESIPKRLDEEYHVIKEDTPLVNVYTTGKVTVKGMLIPDDLLTDAIRDTKAYQDYEEKYGVVEILVIQKELVESTQRTHRTPNPADVIQKKNRKGTPTAGETSSLSKSLKIQFKNGTRIEPVSHKDNSEEVDDDDETKDDEKDDDDDQDDHALIRTRKLGSLEIRTEKMQTPTSSPPRSIGKDLSSDKAIDQELLGIKEKVDKVLHDIVLKIASNATNDLIDDNLPRIVANVVKKEREASQAIVHAMILQEFDVLRAKFEKSSASAGSCRDDAFCKHDHDEHQGDDALPEGEQKICLPFGTIAELYRESDSIGKKYGNTEEKRHVLSLHKIHAISFLEEDLEEKLIRWVGIKSYQIKINLTTPTLIFPGIEECDPFSIVDKQTTGLIYLNSKNEKRFMDSEELLKFCDATLEKVLNEVKLKIFETELLKKAPLL